jgi:hypothetical protein
VRSVVLAHRDHGIPTWQDVEHLDEGPTEDQLREVLRDPTIANGVLWLTPDVADSAIIKTVEAPELLRRARAKDGFFLVPVAAAGLDYADAAGLFEGIYPAHELEHWNLRKAAPIAPTAGRETAARVARRRARAIHKELAPGQTIHIGLFTRVQAPFELGTAFAFDWAHRFDGRLATTGDWSNHLLPALREIADCLQQHAPGRPVVAHGLAALPAGIAFGSVFLTVRGIDLAWRQVTRGRSDELWSLGGEREESRFRTETSGASPSARDLAVFVSVSENVAVAVMASRSELPPFRAVIAVERDGAPPHDLVSPGQAQDVALKTVAAIREARISYSGVERVHLFVAAPVGLAVMIGQLLNTLGPVQTYEHVPTDAVGRYVKGPLLDVGS